MHYVEDLTATVARTAPALRAISDEASARRPAPDQWCAREILGHLIDSAVNNHQRFVLAQWREDLIYPGYDQAAWVRAQDYRHAPWQDLVALWAAYNNHLSRIMAATPAEVRLKQHRRHNLDKLALVPVPTDQPGTLDYLMNDYVVHVHHHLKQIGGLVAHQEIR